MTLKAALQGPQYPLEAETQVDIKIIYQALALTSPTMMLHAITTLTLISATVQIAHIQAPLTKTTCLALASMMIVTIMLEVIQLYLIPYQRENPETLMRIHPALATTRYLSNLLMCQATATQLKIKNLDGFELHTSISKYDYD